MPFKSKAQMRMMYAVHPDIAKRWSKKYKTPKNLPDHLQEGGTPKRKEVMTAEEAQKAKLNVVGKTKDNEAVIQDERGLGVAKKDLDSTTTKKYKQTLWGGSTGTASYRQGGQIQGRGTAKSDSISTNLDQDGFIVPAEHAEAAQILRQKYLVPAKVSNGEHYFTAEEVKKLSANGIDLNKLAPNAKNKLNYAKVASPSLSKKR